MAHEEMQGKDNTLFGAVQELEKAMEKLVQLFELAPSIRPQPFDTSDEGTTELKVTEAITRLGVLRQQLGEAVRLMERLVKVIGG